MREEREKQKMKDITPLNRRWISSEYMIFVTGIGFNENSGYAKEYMLYYGFRDMESDPPRILIEYAERLPFIFATQALEYFAALGYEFFPAGADDPDDALGVFI